MLNGIEKFDDDIFWWHHEELHRQILRDFEHRNMLVRREFEVLENRWLKEAEEVGASKRAALTAEAFSLERETADALIAMLETESVEQKPHFPYKRFWKKQNEKVNLSLK